MCADADSVRLEGAEITIEEAADVLDIIKPNRNALNVKTAWELLRGEQSFRRVVTMVARMDEILDGGVSAGKVTEIAGVAGVGKTQFW